MTITAKLLAAGALAAALTATAVPALAATNELRRHTLHGPPTPVAGLAGTTADVSTKLTFPADWRVRSLKAGVLTLREGSRQCLYTVRASSRVSAADAADASARVTALAPATGARLLESGLRTSAAWRVTRPETGNQQVRIVAVRAQPLRFASGQAGHQLWLETTVTAVSRVGDECHSGTYREVAGPFIGDALATARARAFVRNG
ncbi:MAG: hypothetical protein QOI62_3501 [Solirubrobacteraceae bacterium]|jgi:hypothetical protein|nr:hypothetical protein [Solirubrobacteraceae bacterium]